VETTGLETWDKTDRNLAAALSKERSGGRTICFVAVCKSVPPGASAPRRNQCAIAAAAMQDADLKEILAIALAAVPSHAGDNIRAGSLRIARSGSAARRATSSASTIARCRADLRGPKPRPERCGDRTGE